MPFSKILTQLVESVEGALGAIFLDPECEYVQYYGSIDSFRHKLLGAYQGILLGLVRKAVEKMKIQGIDKIVTEYENARFITKSLKSGYFLVLVMDLDSNFGKGLAAIDEVAFKINEDII